MKRRNFVSGLFSALSFLWLRPLDALGFVWNKGKLTIRNQLGQFPDFSIPFMERDQLIYFSLNTFATQGGFGVYANDARQKTVLYIGEDKATFTAENNFVILNDHIYQMLYVPLWEQGELWVPVRLLAELFTKYTSRNISFDPATKTLTLESKQDINITGIKIETKANGSLIIINSNKKFDQKDISLKIANGWLHVDVFGGKVDSSISKYFKPSGLISAFQAIPFEQIVSLSFKLNKRVLSRELINTPDQNNILINLRTNDKVETNKENRSELEKEKQEWLIDTIVIDPGHGGKDPGAIGYRRLKEKDVVLAVGLKLGKILRKNMPDTKIVFTRDRDVFVPLWRRTQYANEKKGKLFVSLHCNSNPRRQANGFETYFLSADKDKNRQAQNVVLKENASIKFERAEDQQRYKGINFILATMAQSAFIRQSQYLATAVQNSISRKMKPIGLHPRGVKQGRFWVMVGATMPNILIEMGFISNKTESNILKNKSNQQKIAQAIYNGIEKYKQDIEASI